MVEKLKRTKSNGSILIPRDPNKFTTDIETATSSLFFDADGANAAIADEPQMAVPKPINQPVELGQLNFFAKKKILISTTKTVRKITEKLEIPKLEILW